MMATAMQGKTVIVTGGAGGLGKVIATLYLQAGARVAICDVNETRLQECTAEFGSDSFLASKVDITDGPAVQAFVQSVVDKFGRLDVLVNNAGLCDVFDPVGEVSEETWNIIIGVNLTGSFLCAKAAVKAMEKNPPGQDGKPGGGLIIQIGSASGDRGLESGCAYTVSKHGVNGLVKHTAGAYAAKGIYAVGLMLGALAATNIQEGMAKLGKFNMDIFALTSAAGGVSAETAVDLADVAKYCLFLSDRSIAATSNGGLITFRKNHPRV